MSGGSVSPRRQHLLFSTKNPPAIQRIPWPSDEDGNGARRNNFHGYDTWIINEGDFPWFIDGDGMSCVAGLPGTEILTATSIHNPDSAFARDGNRDVDHI